MAYCGICSRDVDDDDMLSNGYYCKSCYKRKYHSGPKKERRNPWEPPTYNNQIPNNPGEFYNEEQRKYVYDILRAIGWTKSHKGHWYDNKLVDRDGKWLVDFGPIAKRQKGMKSRYTHYITNYLNNKIPFITYTNKEPYFTNEQIKEIQKKFFIDRYTAPYLSHYYECDEREILWVIQMTYKRLKELMRYEKGK